MLRAGTAAISKLIAIPDVHGEYEQLRAVLDHIDTDFPEYQLIFLGDLVDRGPESLLVLEEVRRRCEAGAVALLGNHEDALVDYACEDDYSYLSSIYGSEATLKSFERAAGTPMDSSERVKAFLLERGLLAWIRSLPYWHRDGNAVFTHAPVPKHRWNDAGIPDKRSALWGGVANGEYDASLWAPEDCTAFCGHVVVPDSGNGELKPLRVDRGWFLDCGAGVVPHGLLHAAVIEEAEVKSFVTPQGVVGCV